LKVKKFIKNSKLSQLYEVSVDNCKFKINFKIDKCMAPN
jgi:hypothetical protein